MTSITSTPILVSRRVLRQLKPKYPNHFSPPISKSKPKKEEPPWPRWMQIVAYTAAAASVPYSFGIVISESNTFRQYVEGECVEEGENEGLGRKIVNLFRNVWGKEDEIPYVEYLEKKVKSSKTREKEVSLGNEIKTKLRMNQHRIERDVLSNANVVVENEGIVIEGNVKGDVYIGNIGSIWETVSQTKTNNSDEHIKSTKNIILSFQDNDNQTHDEDTQYNNEVSMSDDTSTLTTSITDLELERDSTARHLGDRTAIYSAWNVFDRLQKSQDNKASNNTTIMDSTQIRIDELQFNITELQKLISDPMCTRDRDDMEIELREMKRELNATKRQKRIAKLRKLVPF